VQKHIVCPLLINLVYTHRALLAFHLCDRKNKNSVDLKGLLKKATHVGLDRSSDELCAEFAVVDADGSGRLHFSEFCPWFVETNIEHGSFERYRGEDVISFKRFVLRQDKGEEFELSKFLDAQEIAWKQCAREAAKMTKEWNRLDQNGNGLVSGAEVDTWVQQYVTPFPHCIFVTLCACTTSPSASVPSSSKPLSRRCGQRTGALQSALNRSLCHCFIVTLWLGTSNATLFPRFL
jgi:Ca2+-binding EF-hand superfamily protein